MLIITDIDQIKRLTRRGHKRTVLEELERRGIRYEIAHDGWPVLYMDDVRTIPSTRPNFAAMKVEK